MRICLYTETALPKVGGQEMVVDSLARTYQNLGHEVVVLAPRPRPLCKQDDENLPYQMVRHLRFFSSRFFVSWYRFFLLRLWQQRPWDILHCHGLFPPGFLAALTRPKLRVPVVLTSHGGDVHQDNVRLRKPVVKARIVQALAAADALVAISRFTRTAFLRLCPQARHIVDIPNGVEIRSLMTLAPPPANLDPAIVAGQYLLFLGRLAHRKGVDVLLRALALVPDSGKVQLVIAGDGAERTALETLAGSLGLGNRVRFAGNVSGTAKTYLIQNALCGVMPSRTWEAFPLVILEMFAAGKAVVGTGIPGLEDLIDDGVNGWSVPPENPQALAQALGAVLSTPVRARECGAAARRIACRYDWTAIAQRHLALYEELRSAA